MGLRAESTRGISDRGKRYSVIAAFDEARGYVAHHTVEGTMGLEPTLEFLRHNLVRHARAPPPRRADGATRALADARRAAAPRSSRR